MKITRNVNGTDMEFELTHLETIDAFHERRRTWDMGTILDLLEQRGETGKLKRLEKDKDLLADMAWVFRDVINRKITEDDEMQALDIAYKKCAGRRRRA